MAIAASPLWLGMLRGTCPARWQVSRLRDLRRCVAARANGQTGRTTEIARVNRSERPFGNPATSWRYKACGLASQASADGWRSSTGGLETVQVAQRHGPRTSAEWRQVGRWSTFWPQDNAPLCFRAFEGYYSSRATRSPNSPGCVRNHFGGPMRKPRPATYNPVQALHLIANDRNGSPLSCPSCSGQIERTPDDFPPPPRSQVTLQCRECGRLARYIAGAA